ncbi:MAG TPA: RHS repeat-associated core domain-containing protein, partial [Terriglobales bacterium]|nr:RHS repeat-associated core domain-containing protein [Terriglobales bacterium]
PYGENYAETGTTDRNFTGQNQDTTADLYDFLFREYHPTQGRWLSPDPLGGDISNPQSLNRYAYVLNNPTSLIDLLGLCPKGTHPAVPEEIDRILAAGKELINQTDPPIGYQKGRRHDNEGNLVSCDCSNFINIAINQAGFSVPQASTEQIFYQKDSGQYFQPVQNNSVSVGNVLLVSFPGQPVHSHAVLVASAAPLKVYGSQNSSGPASIPAEGRQLSAFYAEIFAGADAYEICIPDKAEGKKKESNVGTAPLSNLLNNVPNPYWLIWSLFPFGLSYVAPPPPYTEK